MATYIIKHTDKDGNLIHAEFKNAKDAEDFYEIIFRFFERIQKREFENEKAVINGNAVSAHDRSGISV